MSITITIRDKKFIITLKPTVVLLMTIYIDRMNTVSCENLLISQIVINCSISFREHYRKEFNFFFVSLYFSNENF